jgi:hypothetical protein
MDVELGHLGLPRLIPRKYPLMLEQQSTSFVANLHRGPAKQLLASLNLRLQSDSRVQALNGKLIGPGTVRELFSTDRLAQWWVWRANEVGQEIADGDLESYLNKSEVHSLQTLWVYGLETDQAHEIYPGVSLVPTIEMPISQDQEGFLESRFAYSSNITIVPQAALVCRVSIPRNSSEEPSDKMKVVGEAQRKLRAIALIMNCLSATMCFAGFATSYCPPEVPPGFLGAARGGGASIQDILPLTTAVFKEGNTELLRRLVDAYLCLPERDRTRFSRVLHRLSIAKARLEDGDRALDLGIALEMVLLDDKHGGGLPGQHNVQFRLRGSWLIGESADDRKKLFKALGEIYTHRSQVAHTGAAPSIEKMEPATRREVLGVHFSIAERILVRLIENGFPDWNNLILGAS